MSLSPLKAWNLESANMIKNPPWVVEHLHIVGLEQVWRMFSPTPPHHHFWHVIEATLEDGSVVRSFVYMRLLSPLLF